MWRPENVGWGCHDFVRFGEWDTETWGITKETYDLLIELERIGEIKR